MGGSRGLAADRGRDDWRVHRGVVRNTGVARQRRAPCGAAGRVATRGACVRGAARAGSACASGNGFAHARWRSRRRVGGATCVATGACGRAALGPRCESARGACGCHSARAGGCDSWRSPFRGGRGARRLSPGVRHPRRGIGDRHLARRRRRHVGRQVFGAALPASVVRPVSDAGNRRRPRAGLVRGVDQRRAELRRSDTPASPCVLDDRLTACCRALDDRQPLDELTGCGPTYNRACPHIASCRPKGCQSPPVRTRPPRACSTCSAVACS